MAIAATLDDGQVRMGGVGSGLWIDLGEPTFALPADITDEHCYLKNGTLVYLKVLSSTELMLKRAVADLTLDKLILEEAAKGNF